MDNDFTTVSFDVVSDCSLECDYASLKNGDTVESFYNDVAFDYEISKVIDKLEIKVIPLLTEDQVAYLSYNTLYPKGVSTTYWNPPGWNPPGLFKVSLLTPHVNDVEPWLCYDTLMQDGNV